MLYHVITQDPVIDYCLIFSRFIFVVKQIKNKYFKIDKSNESRRYLNFVESI